MQVREADQRHRAGAAQVPRAGQARLPHEEPVRRRRAGRVRRLPGAEALPRQAARDRRRPGAAFWEISRANPAPPAHRRQSLLRSAQLRRRLPTRPSHDEATR